MTMTPAHPAPWQNPRILVTVLIVFLCGASAGMLAMALGAHRLIHRPHPASLSETKRELLEHFQRELDLTPPQTEQLETVLDDFFTYYHTLQAQLDDVKASGRQRILRILDDKQKIKFEKIMSELQQKQLR